MSMKLNRRNLLMTPVAAALLPRRVYAMQLASVHGEIYRQIGIRPLINAAGTYTTLTGSLLVPQARDAMAEASRCFVPLIDLQKAAAARIAKLLNVPAAVISSGGAGSILLATAACLTGKDQQKIRSLPDTTSMKNEVIMVREHRMGFDHACRATGARIMEVETADQLNAAINAKTAMLFWVNISEPKGRISANDFLQAGKRAGIPVFNDAAAELPPAGNLSDLVHRGYDLVGFSGGKGLRGCSLRGRALMILQVSKRLHIWSLCSIRRWPGETWRLKMAIEINTDTIADAVALRLRDNGILVPRLLTLEQAATYLGLTKDALKAKVHMGRIRPWNSTRSSGSTSKIWTE